jgi:hypothetical protein
MGLLLVALQKGIKVGLVVHLQQLDDGPMLFERYSIVANIGGGSLIHTHITKM